MRGNYFLLIFISVFLGFLVIAQELPGVTFPIAELGNCGSQAECAAYCDLPENMPACLDFAEAHGLIPAEEVALARKMLELGVTAGPGGCRGQAECSAYCDDLSHIEECLNFAEKYGLIPPKELEEGKKVVVAIRQGVKPPNCRSKTECDVYCNQPENMEECLNFALAAGIIPPEEQKEAKMAMEVVKKGVKPPLCRGRAECDIYCSAPEHLEECLTFAQAAGFISPEEAVIIRKTSGRGPGGCRGKEACEAYCEDPAHAEECLNFALEYGFMPPKEAEMAKKMLAAGLTGGPGGCRGKEECEAYCNDISHMLECVEFAERAGFISPEDAARARRMRERGLAPPGNCQGEEECRAYCEDPAHAEECLNFAVKIGEMRPEEAEKARKGMEIIQRGGPGGCKSKKECDLYCQDPGHAKECLDFAVQQGFMSSEEAQRIMKIEPPPTMPPTMPPEKIPPPSIPPEEMPLQRMPTLPPDLIKLFEGKCTTLQECLQYCLQNPTDPACQAMRSKGMPQIPPPPVEEMPLSP